MNARLHPATDLAAIQSKTAIAREALADLRAMGQWPIPIESFKDDDLYLYNAATKQLIREFSCGDQNVKDARHIGFRVFAGETWGKGMAVKRLGLWRAA